MRILASIAVLAGLALSGCCTTAECGKAECPAIQTAGKAKVLRHVVMFSFKQGTTPEQIQKVEQAFAQLPKKIDTIIGFEWGTNNSPENLSQGYTHCFFLSFKDEAGRAVYLPHSEHKAFGATLGPVLDKVLVLDYWAQTN
jgi:hypothetical protein